MSGQSGQIRALTAEQIAGNAYRALGLPATATQADVEQAARKMRIWKDPKHIPPTPWDVPWVGPLDRSRGAIEQAVARLVDPESRIAERLTWFHQSAPQTGPDIPDSFRQSLDDLDPHDRALVLYRAALLTDPDVKDAQRWRGAIESMRSVAGSTEFASYLLQLESDSDFEKRADESEVRSALTSIPRAITSALASRAESAMEDDRLEPAVNIAALLREEDPIACGSVLDRVEDVVERRCSSSEDDLRRVIRFNDPSARANNEAACRRIQNYYEQSIEPVARALQPFGVEAPHRIERVRWAQARLLSMLGTAWISANYFLAADRILRLAKKLATATALERRIDTQIAQNAPRAAQQQRLQPGDTTGIYNVMDVQAPPGKGPHPPRVQYAAPRQPGRQIRQTAKKSPSPLKFGWFILVIASSLIRFIAGTSNSSSTPSYPNFNSPVYRLNAPGKYIDPTLRNAAKSHPAESSDLRSNPYYTSPLGHTAAPPATPNPSRIQTVPSFNFDNPSSLFLTPTGNSRRNSSR